MNKVKEEVLEEMKGILLIKPENTNPKGIIIETINLTEKEVEKKVVEVIEDCKVYRGVFILKTELIRKLEEAFPEI